MPRKKAEYIVQMPAKDGTTTEALWIDHYTGLSGKAAALRMAKRNVRGRFRIIAMLQDGIIEVKQVDKVTVVSAEKATTT